MEILLIVGTFNSLAQFYELVCSWCSAYGFNYVDKYKMHKEPISTGYTVTHGICNTN